MRRHPSKAFLISGIDQGQHHVHAMHSGWCRPRQEADAQRETHLLTFQPRRYTESPSYALANDRYTKGRELETLHLFQPPRADQMPEPLQGQDQHHSIYLGMPG